jgi:hypothetical protein
VADYPTIVQIYGTRRTGDDGTVVEKADSGKPRLRSFFTQVRYSFTVIHDVDGPDKDLVLAHYATDQNLIFNFTFKADSTVHSCRYAQAPFEEPIAGVDRWRVTVSLVVV